MRMGFFVTTIYLYCDAILEPTITTFPISGFDYILEKIQQFFIFYL